MDISVDFAMMSWKDEGMIPRSETFLDIAVDIGSTVLSGARVVLSFVGHYMLILFSVIKAKMGYTNSLVISSHTFGTCAYKQQAYCGI